VGENLQDGDRVSRVKQVGVTPKGFAEGPPDVPGTVRCQVVGMTDCQGKGVLDSAEIMAETVSFGGWANIQDGVVGYC